MYKQEMPVMSSYAEYERYKEHVRVVEDLRRIVKNNHDRRRFIRLLWIVIAFGFVFAWVIQ